MTQRAAILRPFVSRVVLLFLSLALPAGDACANLLNLITPAVLTKQGWRNHQLLEQDDAGDAQFPQLAFDKAGNAIAVWEQHDGERFNIWAARYVAGGGWQTAQLIESDDAGDALDSQIAFDGAGNAIAVWGQSDGTRDNIWAARYAAGSGWQTAQLIESDNAGAAYFPQIAFDGAGNAIAVWQQGDGTRDNIWAARYAAGSGWQPAQLIESDDAGDAYLPQITFDGAGNAIAVWQQADGTRDNIWAAHYTAGSGWQTGQLIEQDNAGHAEFPQIAVDAAGNALAVWQQHDGTHDNIWAARYAAGSGWQPAQLIENDDAGNAWNPQVAFDAAGNAIAVWQQGDGTRDNIWAARYAAGSGWQPAQLIENDDAGDAQFPQIAVDGAGKALAVWQQSDGTSFNIWAAHYTEASGWQPARLIETDNAGDAQFPQIAVDGTGKALAVWMQYEGSSLNIWAAEHK